MTDPPPPMTSADAQALISMIGDVFPVLLLLLVALVGFSLGRWAVAAGVR